MPNNRLNSRPSGRIAALAALAFAVAAGCSNGKAKEKDAAEADTSVPVEVQEPALEREQFVIDPSGPLCDFHWSYITPIVRAMPRNNTS